MQAFISGSHRFNRILRAVKDGADAVPMDLRYVSQPRSKLHGESSTAHVVSYLQGLYDSVAETLPDVKDDGVIMELHDGPNPGADTYGDSLSSGKFYPHGMKRPRTRKWKMSLKLHQERRADVSGKEVRHLPPGVMQDHWQTMRALGGPALHISFKHFWSVWHQEFPFLRFRSTSNHAQCSQCLHHKLVIRELHAHMAARQKQAELLRHHLMAQYRDRLAYWSLRGTSRLGCSSLICCILDGMDQCKFLYPRSVLMTAKDLGQFQRPRLHVVGCIVHGWGVAMAISGHDQKKDSSMMTEIVAFLLTRMQASGVNLARCHFHLQGDNTSREVKNSTLMRFLSALTSHKICQSTSMGHLRSGHSHDDVDQMFSSCALHLVRYSKLAETPSDFVHTIQSFVDGLPRPHERHRLVFPVDQHRDWLNG